MQKINLVLTIIISLSYLQPIAVIAQVQDESVSETNQTYNSSADSINNDTSQSIYSGNHKESSSNESSTPIKKIGVDNSLTNVVNDKLVLQ